MPFSLRISVVRLSYAIPLVQQGQEDNPLTFAQTFPEAARVLASARHDRTDEDNDHLFKMLKALNFAVKSPAAVQYATTAFLPVGVLQCF